MKADGIAVIGRVADGAELFDGQTVKTRTLRDELARRFPGRELVCVDTYQYKRRILPILFSTLHAFMHCGHIFILLSRNGRKFFFPLINGLNRVFHRRLYHDAVGGALPDEAAGNPALIRNLNRFEVNWVEFDDMRIRLAGLGVSNAEVLPNFKQLTILAENQLPEIETDPFRFVTFSRVTRDKGITSAAEAVVSLNGQYGDIRAVLHIYGPVDPDYQEELNSLTERHPESVFYMGCVPYDQSVDVLKNSFMLLFPTVYPGEGMPGTIIDAYSAGVPVIATDWHFNSELVHHGKTGFCYAWQQPERLEEWMRYAAEHPDQIERMRPQCLAEAGKYTPDAVMGTVLARMEAEPE